MLWRVRSEYFLSLPPDEGVGAGGEHRGRRWPLRSTRGRKEESRGGAGGRGEEMMQQAAVAMTTVLSSWPDSLKWTWQERKARSNMNGLKKSFECLSLCVCVEGMDLGFINMTRAMAYDNVISSTSVYAHISTTLGKLNCPLLSSISSSGKTKSCLSCLYEGQ